VWLQMRVSGGFWPFIVLVTNRVVLRDLEVLVTNRVVVRDGGLSTAKFHVFLARVFLDISQEALIHNIIEFLRQNLVFGRG
jgi:hypothetical protein